MKTSYKLEAFDYVQYLFEKYHDHMMHGVIKFNSFIDEKVLKKSFVETLKSLPQLVCKLENNRWIPINYKLDDVVKVKKSNLLKEDIMNALTKANNTKTGPQISLTILRGEEKDVLCVVMNHMLCDGMAFKEYLYLLSETYSYIKENKTIKIKYNCNKRDINELIKYNKKHIKLSSKSVAPSNVSVDLDGDENNSVIFTDSIDKNNFALIKKYSKENEVTINDIFMTAYFRAFYKVFNKKIKFLICAVDIRKYLKNKKVEGLCNMTSNLKCAIDYEDINEDLLSKVSSCMKKQKNSYDCLKQIYLLNLIYKKLPFALSKRIIKKALTNPPIAFTNLGIIDENKLSFSNLYIEKCFVTGAVKKIPNFQVAVSTFKNEVTISINLKIKKSHEEKVQKFIECFIDETLRIRK